MAVPSSRPLRHIEGAPLPLAGRCRTAQVHRAATDQVLCCARYRVSGHPGMMTAPDVPAAAGPQPGPLAGPGLGDLGAAAVIVTGLRVSNAASGLQVFWLIVIALAAAATRYRPPPGTGSGGGRLRGFGTTR